MIKRPSVRSRDNPQTSQRLAAILDKNKSRPPSSVRAAREVPPGNLILALEGSRESCQGPTTVKRT
eukprot:4031762-Amphidinium_carterae.2